MRRKKRRGKSYARWSAAEDVLLSKMVRDGYAARSIEQALRPLHPLRMSGKDPKAKRTWVAIRDRIDRQFRRESEQARQGMVSIRGAAELTGVTQRTVARIVEARGIATRAPLQSVKVHRRGGPKALWRLVDKEEVIDAVRDHLAQTSDGRCGPRSYAYRHLDVAVAGKTNVSRTRRSIVVARALCYAAALQGIEAQATRRRRALVWRLPDAEWAPLVPIALRYLAMSSAQRGRACRRAMGQARERFAARSSAK